MSNTNQANPDAMEFSRRRNLPGVEVRYMINTRTNDIVLTLCGREIASKTEVIKRGKVVSVFYSLPAMV